MSVHGDELSALKFLDRLQGYLKHVREPQNAFRYALRETHGFFGASQGGIARLQPGRPQAEILFSIPRGWLWDVDDRSTATLMNGVYARLAAGVSPAVALRDAKRELIKSGYPRPYYWAPFQLFTVVL